MRQGILSSGCKDTTFLIGYRWLFSIFGDKDTIFIIWGIHLGFKKTRTSFFRKYLV